MKLIRQVFIILFIAMAFGACNKNFAKYDGGEITQDEINKLANERIDRLKEEIENVKKRAAEQVLFRELLDKAAGKDIQGYFTKFVTAKKDAISDELVAQYILINRIAPQATPQLISEYKSHLASSQMDLYRDLLYLELIKKYNVQFLEKSKSNVKRQQINLEGMPTKGVDKAAITIVEFTDFQCPYCRRSFNTMKALKDLFKEKIRFVYADFPLDFHAFGKKAAQGARCAGEQNFFWQYHDALFLLEKIKSDQDMLQIAKILKLDMGKFSSCYASDRYLPEVDKYIKYGQSLGVSGTPAFFINGRFVSGALPLSEFVDILNQEGLKL